MHGGLLVTLLDEVMGSIPFKAEGIRVTRSMDVRFRLPVSIDVDVEAVATIGARNDRTVALSGYVRHADDAARRVEVFADYVVLGDPGPRRADAAGPL